MANNDLINMGYVPGDEDIFGERPLVTSVLQNPGGTDKGDQRQSEENAGKYPEFSDVSDDDLDGKSNVPEPTTSKKRARPGPPGQAGPGSSHSPLVLPAPVAARGPSDPKGSVQCEKQFPQCWYAQLAREWGLPAGPFQPATVALVPDVEYDSMGQEISDSPEQEDRVLPDKQAYVAQMTEINKQITHEIHVAIRATLGSRERRQEAQRQFALAMRSEKMVLEINQNLKSLRRRFAHLKHMAIMWGHDDEDDWQLPIMNW